MKIWRKQRLKNERAEKRKNCWGQFYQARVQIDPFRRYRIDHRGKHPDQRTASPQSKIVINFAT